MHSSIRERIAHGMGWATVARVAGVCFSMGVNMLLARILPLDQMGQYFLIVSLVSVSVIVAQMGLPTALVRLVAEALGSEHLGRARYYIFAGLKIGSIIAFAVGLLLWLGVGNWVSTNLFHAPVMLKAIGIVTIWVFLAALQKMTAEIFRGFHDIQVASILNNVVTPLFSAILFGVVWLLQGHSNLHEAVLLSMGAVATTAMISFLMLWKKVRLLTGERGEVGSKELIQIAWPIFIINLSAFFATKGDIWIVGGFLSKDNAAVYGAVLRMVYMLTMAYAMVVGVIQSTVAELYSRNDMVALERLVRTMALVNSAISSIIMICFVFFGKPILEMVFGNHYQVGYWPLIILSMFHLISIFLGPKEIVLMMTGYERQLLLPMAITGIFRIGLAIFLVKPFGIVGVAFAWGLGDLVHSFYAWWIVREKLGVFCHAKNPFLLYAR